MLGKRRLHGSAQRRYHEKRNSTFVYMHPCHFSIVSAIEMDIHELRISEFVVIAHRGYRETQTISVFVAQTGKCDGEGDR
jgi:hypothetical protein